MDEKTVGVTEKVIGDTLYVIESVVSSSAKETAYEKLKRLILEIGSAGNVCMALSALNSPFDSAHERR